MTLNLKTLQIKLSHTRLQETLFTLISGFIITLCEEDISRVNGLFFLRPFR